MGTCNSKNCSQKSWEALKAQQSQRILRQLWSSECLWRGNEPEGWAIWGWPRCRPVSEDLLLIHVLHWWGLDVCLYNSPRHLHIVPRPHSAFSELSQRHHRCHLLVQVDPWRKVRLEVRLCGTDSSLSRLRNSRCECQHWGGVIHRCWGHRAPLSTPNSHFLRDKLHFDDHLPQHYEACPRWSAALRKRRRWLRADNGFQD